MVGERKKNKAIKNICTYGSILGPSSQLWTQLDLCAVLGRGDLVSRHRSQML